MLRIRKGEERRGEKMRVQVFYFGNLREIGHLKESVIDMNITLRCIFRKRNVSRIELAMERDRCWSFVNAV